MQYHTLKRNRANRKAKQVGRGGTRGKTSGRGTKGQNARSGRKKRPEMRDVIKRLPKLRGRGKNSLKSRLQKDFPVKISTIEEAYKAGETVNPKTLLQKGIIKSKSGRLPSVKILADRELKKAFIFENVKISEKVKAMMG